MFSCASRVVVYGFKNKFEKEKVRIFLSFEKGS